MTEVALMALPPCKVPATLEAGQGAGNHLDQIFNPGSTRKQKRREPSLSPRLHHQCASSVHGPLAEVFTIPAVRDAPVAFTLARSGSRSAFSPGLAALACAACRAVCRRLQVHRPVTHVFTWSRFRVSALARYHRPPCSPAPIGFHRRHSGRGLWLPGSSRPCEPQVRSPDHMVK